LKRVFDIVFSLLLSITLLPVFLILIVLIKIDSRGPILFKQKRVGKNKKYFNILKFRTMYIYTPKDKPTHLLENPEQYITRVGKFLRKTSLDELPQIWNILIGQMSVIGPRPALWNQYDLINERENFKVNEIRPGLTGWAQINGRDELPIKVKAEFDHYYIKNMSFALDCKCFFGTILSVIKHEGVVEGGTGSLQILQQEIAASKEISIGEELSK
jgi:O-antigen biosynthesis protein WbqP